MELAPERPLVVIAFGEEHVRRLMELELIDAGIDVLSTASADDALNMVRVRDPDLVIFDRFMADEGAAALLVHLATLRGATRLVITCDGHDVERARVETPGAEVMLKPFAPGQLVEVCRGLLGDSPASSTEPTT